MKKLGISLLLLTTSSYSALGTEFPENFVGSWKGDCTSASVDGSSIEFRSELLVKKLGVGNYVWKSIYIMNGERQLRDYNLILSKDNSNAFVIDENNGLVLDGFSFGNIVYQHFQLNNGVAITARYEVRGEQLSVEYPSWSTIELRETRLTGGDTEVSSLKNTGLQRCLLNRLEQSH